MQHNATLECCNFHLYGNTIHVSNMAYAEGQTFDSGIQRLFVRYLTQRSYDNYSLIKQHTFTGLRYQSKPQWLQTNQD